MDCDWRENTTSIKQKINYTLANENSRQDVIIISGRGETEVELKAHSYMLYIGSLVFENLLEEIEVNSEGMKVINMPDVCLGTLRCILEFIYTDGVANLENEDAIDILHGAVKFKLTGLVAMCVSKLKNEISSRNAIRIYEEAGRMAIKELVQYSLEYIFKNVADIFQQPHFLKVKETTLCKLLSFDELKIDEVFLFNAIMRWGVAKCQQSLLEENVENMRHVLKNVVIHVRFPLMSMQEFANVVVPSQILLDKQVIEVFKYLSSKSFEERNQIEPRQLISSSSEKKSNGEYSGLPVTKAESSVVNEAQRENDVKYDPEPKNVRKERLVQYLKELTGKKTISGLISEMYPVNRDKGLELIENIAGVKPGILNTLMPSYADKAREWRFFAQEVITNWNNGYLVRILWCEEHHPLVQLKHLGSSDETKWQNLIKEEGKLNKEWKRQLDAITPYLQQLQDAGVVVLFDILPSINRNANWWAGRYGINGTLKLFQITHDYLTKYHGLDCLLWTWSLHIGGDMIHLDEIWPGNDFVDIVSVNMWDNKSLHMESYKRILKFVGDKPLSMENLWTVPTPELLDRQPRWTLFSVNDLFLNTPKYNTEDNVKAIFQCPSIINKGDNDFFQD